MRAVAGSFPIRREGLDHLVGLLLLLDLLGHEPLEERLGRVVTLR